MMLADRERIARDLHDLVIQRVFAAGMSLQSVANLTERPELAERVNHVIDELDKVTNEISTTIFGLELHQESASSLRRKTLELTGAAAATHGYEPVVRLRGQIGSAHV